MNDLKEIRKIKKENKKEIENKILTINKLLKNNKYSYMYYIIENDNIYKISNRNKYNYNIHILLSTEKNLNKTYKVLLNTEKI